jgi:predicted metal-dependent hydrolase
MPSILASYQETKYIFSATIKPVKKTTHQKIFEVAGKSITVSYRKIKKAKGIRIAISSGEKVTVTGSSYVSFRSLERFFLTHQDWAEKKLSHFQLYPNTTHKLSQEDYQEKKETARKLVHTKLTQWNERYQFSWKRVTIRNQSTRWGSCSSAGTLSFHAAIVDLPEDLQDYLIVHELCHIKAMNHSEKFWTLVEHTLPEARQLDARLKKHRTERVV